MEERKIADKNYDEPIIEVTSTPIDGEPEKHTFPFSTESPTISGSTVPQVAGDLAGQAMQVTDKFLDHLRDRYRADEHDIVIKVTEDEEKDRGWFTHMDMGGSFNFPKGKGEARVKGTPKKEKRTKETTIRIGLEKKKEQDFTCFVN